MTSGSFPTDVVNPRGCSGPMTLYRHKVVLPSAQPAPLPHLSFFCGSDAALSPPRKLPWAPAEGEEEFDLEYSRQVASLPEPLSRLRACNPSGGRLAFGVLPRSGGVGLAVDSDLLHTDFSLCKGEGTQPAAFLQTPNSFFHHPVPPLCCSRRLQMGGGDFDR